MPEPAKKFSIWSIPREAWTSRPDLEALEVTEDAIARFNRDLAEDIVEERVRPFKTPVTQDTLSKSVK